MILLLSLISKLALAQCPVLPPIAEFDPAAYFDGVWYEIRVSNGFATQFQAELTCVSAEYALTDGTVAVTNCGISTEDGSQTCDYATARAQESGTTGHFEVSFYGAPYAPYVVLATTGSAEDGYEAALVHSCAFFFGTTSESMWVLSRTRDLDDATVDELLSYASSIGIDVEALGMRYNGQEDCEADEDGDDVVTQTEYEALLAQIEANQAALDDMSSSALGAAMDIAQWQEDVESCASDILADDDDMRRQLLSHEQEEYDALEAENAKLRAAIKQEFLTKYS